MFGFGSTDINDLITNTIGVCLGYGIYKLFYITIPESWIKSLRVGGVQSHYELLFFGGISLLIMITLQPYIYDALFATSMTGGEIHTWK